MDPLINPEPNVYEAVMIAEGVQPASEEEQIAAWQLLVNNGLAFFFVCVGIVLVWLATPSRQPLGASSIQEDATL